MDRLTQGRSLRAVPTSLEEAALAFRLGAEGEGSERLLAFIGEVLPFLQEMPTPAIGEANRILTEILSAQERRDFLYLADLLEYPLAAILSQTKS